MEREIVLIPAGNAIKRPGVRFLRADINLEAGHVLTVEPGLYFQPWELGKPELRRKYRDAVGWDMVDRFLSARVGGVRIEDDILVTESDKKAVVITGNIPKNIADIEELRRE